MSITTISPHRLTELCKNGKIDLIAVRTPVEFREVHVEHARNVPLDRLDPATVIQGRNGRRDEPLYVLCRSGSRGRQACEKFLAAGFTNIVNVEGGTLACVGAGLPVVRGKKAISLERQVRIAAGEAGLPQGVCPPGAPRRLLPWSRGHDPETPLRSRRWEGAGGAGRGR